MTPPTLRQARLGPAPALLVWSGDQAAAARRGTVLFWHGLGAAKETNRTEYESLAARGFLVAGLDNAGHGARRHPDFDARYAHANPSLEHDFVADVLATAREVPLVVDALVHDHGADPGRLGATGISMGGFVLYAALLVEPRLAVGCPILGSPRFKVPHPDSPHHHLHRFFPRALLSQNAGADRSVPPQHARELHERLAPSYAAAPERQRYVEFPGADHFMPEADWNRLWANVLAWFERWL